MAAMRYLEPENHTPDWQAYFAYLQSIRHLLPAHVWQFAADEGHYNLHDRRSLHDAWLEQCSVEESAEGSRYEIRQTHIRLRFLGPWHDRHIHLHYVGVQRYSLAQNEDTPSHGDLLTHELSLQDGLLLHALAFANGARWYIACKELQHWQEMLTPSGEEI